MATSGFFSIEPEDQVRIGKFSKSYVNIYMGYPLDLSKDNRAVVDPTTGFDIRNGPLIQIRPHFRIASCSKAHNQTIVDASPIIIGSRGAYGAQGSVNPDCISDCGGAGSRAVFNEKFRNFTPRNDATVNPQHDPGRDGTLETLAPDMVGQIVSTSSITNESKGAYAGISFLVSQSNADVEIVFAWNDAGEELRILKDTRSRVIAAAQLNGVYGGSLFSVGFSGTRWYYEVEHNFGSMNYMAQVTGHSMHGGVESKVIYKKNSLIIAQYWNKKEASTYGRTNHLNLPERLDVVFFK